MTQATLVRLSEVQRVAEIWRKRQAGAGAASLATEQLQREIATALAYCYVYDARPDLRQWLGIMRLAGWGWQTISTGGDDPEPGLDLDEETVAIVRWLAARWQGEVTTTSTPSRPTGLSEADSQVLIEALQLGHLVASGQVPQPAQIEALQAAHIGLAMGGAVKIKEYVFESSGLPEVRGASALLDYINLKMIPALFNQLNPDEADSKRVADYKPNLALVPEALIYANGGEFLAFAPASQVKELALTVERFYAVETLTAQAVAIGETFSLYELSQGLEREPVLPPVLAQIEQQREQSDSPGKAAHDTGAFSQAVSYLSLLRRRRQEFNPVVMRQWSGETSTGSTYGIRQLASFETFPAGQHCDSCDRRLAVAEWPRAGTTYHVCESCARKAVVGQRQRDEDMGKWFTSQHFTWQAPRLESWQEKFNDVLGENEALKTNYWRNTGIETPPKDLPRMANDLNEIAAVKRSGVRAEGFIGVIYGDGNNMGGLLQKIKTPVQYRQFAEQVYQTLIEAVNKGLAQELFPEREKETGKWYHPFEILSIGGDDIYLFVPGWAAPDVCLSIAKEVETKLGLIPQFALSDKSACTYVQRCQVPNPATQSEVSLSSGVLVANVATPVYFLDQMVGELLKSAKKKAAQLRENNQYYGATVDFMALKSVTMMSNGMKKWRENTLYRKRLMNTTELRVTERPYTLPELESLLETLRQLKEPGNESLRSELLQLQEQLLQGKQAGEVNYRYWLARHRGQVIEKDGKKKSKDQQLQSQFERWTAKNTVVPWRVSQEVHTEYDRQKDERVEKTVSIFSSIVGDLVELYDFIPTSEGNNGQP